MVEAAIRAREVLASVVPSSAAAATSRKGVKPGAAASTPARLAIGASLLAKGGKTFSGCSVHSKPKGPEVIIARQTVTALAPPDANGLCAERIAVVKAMSEGFVEFEAVYIFSDLPDKALAPCPSCRSVSTCAACLLWVLARFAGPLVLPVWPVSAAACWLATVSFPCIWSRAIAPW